MIFSAFDCLFNQILQAIEEPELRHIMTLGDGRNKIAAIDIPGRSAWIGQPINAIWERSNFPEQTLILGLLKSRKQHFSRSAERPIIDPHDELIALGSQADIHQLIKLIEGA